MLGARCVTTLLFGLSLFSSALVPECRIYAERQKVKQRTVAISSSRDSESQVRGVMVGCEFGVGDPN
jgi:hypothetical protein